MSDASIQGCYEPFQYRLKGDHRTMVVDFDTNLLFGNPTTTLATLAQREFSSKEAGEQPKLHRDAIQRGDHDTAKAIKYRLAAERTKQMYQKLRYIWGIQKTGISHLEVPQDSTNFDYKHCTEWITIDTPQDIESKLREHNQRHFGQAHGTFPTVPPFSEWIDWGASSHISELILEGTFQPPEVDSLTSELLQHMK